MIRCTIVPVLWLVLNQVSGGQGRVQEPNWLKPVAYYEPTEQQITEYGNRGYASRQQMVLYYLGDIQARHLDNVYRKAIILQWIERLKDPRVVHHATHEWKEYRLGKLLNDFQVLRVVSPTEIAATHEGQSYWLEGWSTDRIEARQTIHIRGVVYQDLPDDAGIPRLRPVNLDKHSWRFTRLPYDSVEWKGKDDKVIVEGVLTEYSKGLAVVVTANKEGDGGEAYDTVEIPIGKLDKDSAQRVRAWVKERKALDKELNP